MNTKKIFAISLVSTTLLAGSTILASNVLASDNNFDPFDIRGRVSQILGINEDKLDEAFKIAREERLDYLVENGRISEEEAQRRKEFIENEEMGFGFGNKRGSSIKEGREMISDLADYLGVNKQDIINELQDGKSIEDIINENGKDIEKVQEYLKTKAESKIDELVDSGRFNENRAQNMKDHLDDRIENFLTNNHHPRFNQMGRYGRFNK